MLKSNLAENVESVHASSLLSNGTSLPQGHRSWLDNCWSPSTTCCKLVLSIWSWTWVLRLGISVPVRAAVASSVVVGGGGIIVAFVVSGISQALPS